MPCQIPVCSITNRRCRNNAADALCALTNGEGPAQPAQSVAMASQALRPDGEVPTPQAQCRQPLRNARTLRVLPGDTS